MPTTTVGSTNGTTRRAQSTRLAGNVNRANRAAMGMATTRVTTVDAVASQSVNQATLRYTGSLRTSRMTPRSQEEPGCSPRPMMAAMG